MSRTFHRGFTLIEILIVIALIAILAGAVIIALNPGRQFSQSRNSTRQTHVTSILNAVQQNAADNQGNFVCAAGTIPATATPIQSAAGGYNLCSCLVSNYMSALPFDPSATGAHYTSCADYTTGYNISRDATTGRLTIAAPAAELSQTISVMR